jgi:type I restriction enzyme S subunit
MSNEMTIIPQLRFPEFLEKDGWEIKEVGEIFQVTRGYVLSMTLVKEVPTEEYPYPVFSSQTKNNGLAGYYNEYLYEDAITWTTDGANAGDVNYRDGKFYCTNVCGVLLNEEGFANPCIAELINSVSKKHVSYVGNPKLMNGVMSKIQIPVPSIPEQQKIASCLSSLDELIAALKDKLAALKDHKKGLLQNLFPQEGETVPKVRFPEFEGDGEWVEKELSEVSTIITGSTPSTKVPEFYGGDIMFVSPADISNNKYVKTTDKTLTRAGFEKTRKVKSNSVMFVCIGSTIGKVAMNKYDCATNQQINSLVPNTENASDFLYSNLELNAFKISGIAGNQAVPIINKTLFSSVKLKFPPSKKEQQKIAACLSAVDELITAQQEKIEELQQHKKGLMQGLFPKMV